MSIGFIDIIEYVGTFAFAISGIRLAAANRFDWFGAYVVGFVTAVGGGTVRDLLLDLTPFWMLNTSYLICTGVALAAVLFFKDNLMRFKNAFFLFDSIGLALFVVVGVEKTLLNGFPFWVAILMGSITGAAGGVMRDILINEVPLIFRKEIYAIACIIGGLVYWLMHSLHCDQILTQLSSAASVLLVRLLAVKYKISLPLLESSSQEV